MEKNRSFKGWHRESDHNRATYLFGCKASASSFRHGPPVNLCTHHNLAPAQSHFQPRRSSEISLWRTHVTPHRSEMLCLRTLAEVTMLAVRIFPELRIARRPCLAVLDRLVGLLGACALRFGVLLALSLQISPALSLACGGGVRANHLSSQIFMTLPVRPANSGPSLRIGSVPACEGLSLC